MYVCMYVCMYYVETQYVCIHNLARIPTDAIVPHQKRSSVLSIETTRLGDHKVLQGVPDPW